VSAELTIQVNNEVVFPCDIHRVASRTASLRERTDKECRRAWTVPTAVRRTTSCSSSNNSDRHCRTSSRIIDWL